MAYFGHISAIAEKPSFIKTIHHESTYKACLKTYASGADFSTVAICIC